MGEPYGWSQDAVDALLATFCTSVSCASSMPAARRGRPASSIVRDVTASTFSRETAPLSNEEKRAIARLVKCKPDEAEARAPEFVAKLKDAPGARHRCRAAPRSPPSELIDELAATLRARSRQAPGRRRKAPQTSWPALEAQAAKIAQREPPGSNSMPCSGHMNGLPEAAAHHCRARRHPRWPPVARRPGQGRTARQSRRRRLARSRQQAFGAYRSEYDHCTKELEGARSGASSPPKIAPPFCAKCSSRQRSTPKLGTLAELARRAGRLLATALDRESATPCAAN
jgi:hypothetical protein